MLLASVLSFKWFINNSIKVSTIGNFWFHWNVKHRKKNLKNEFKKKELIFGILNVKIFVKSIFRSTLSKKTLPIFLFQSTIVLSMQKHTFWMKKSKNFSGDILPIVLKYENMLFLIGPRPSQSVVLRTFPTICVFRGSNKS